MCLYAVRYHSVLDLSKRVPAALRDPSHESQQRRLDRTITVYRLLDPAAPISLSALIPVSPLFSPSLPVRP